MQIQCPYSAFYPISTACIVACVSMVNICFLPIKAEDYTYVFFITYMKFGQQKMIDRRKFVPKTKFLDHVILERASVEYVQGCLCIDPMKSTFCTTSYYVQSNTSLIKCTRSVQVCDNATLYFSGIISHI